MKNETYLQTMTYRRVKKDAKYFLSEYNDFLDKDRGLASATRKQCCSYVHHFLQFKFGSKPIRIKHIIPKDITDYILFCFKKKAHKMFSGLQVHYVDFLDS